jgi:hypothetical protein
MFLYYKRQRRPTAAAAAAGFSCQCYQGWGGGSAAFLRLGQLEAEKKAVVVTHSSLRKRTIPRKEVHGEVVRDMSQKLLLPPTRK